MAVPAGAPTRADTDAKVLAADALVRLTQTAGCDSKMSGSSSDYARSLIGSHAHRATTKKLLRNAPLRLESSSANAAQSQRAQGCIGMLSEGVKSAVPGCKLV